MLQACISGALGRSAAEVELNQSHRIVFLNVAKMQELIANKEFSKFRTIVVELFGRIYRWVNQKGMFLDRNSIDIVSGSWQSWRIMQRKDDRQSILNAEKVKYKGLWKYVTLKAKSYTKVLPPVD